VKVARSGCREPVKSHGSNGESYSDAMASCKAMSSCSPEDVADVVVFLCADQARFMTGQGVNVAGGLYMA
jgi:NAD(P)-dependent dehydrogenase (short-subunit alcohol dehydrogenase family)